MRALDRMTRWVQQGWSMLTQGEKETYLSRTEANRLLGRMLEREKK